MTIPGNLLTTAMVVMPHTDVDRFLDPDLFFSAIDRPRGIHLCGNPDWDFLRGLDMDILSLDIYTNADIFGASTRSVKLFLDKGGILVWGIVPTGMESFETENLDPVFRRAPDHPPAMPWFFQSRCKKTAIIIFIV